MQQHLQTLCDRSCGRLRFSIRPKGVSRQVGLVLLPLINNMQSIPSHLTLLRR